MANSLTTNPVVFDTAGATSALAGPLYVQAISVEGSGAFVVDIRDSASGNVVFYLTPEITDTVGKTFALANPIKVAGLYAQTLTNVTNVLIYLG